MMVFDVLNISMQGIARAVFNYMFFMVVMILFLLIKKMNDANFYNKDQARSDMAMMVEVATQGTIGGFLCSLVLIFMGMPIHFSDYIILLLPISLVLGLTNIRYLCMSHSVSVLAVLALLFNGQTIGTITLPNVDIEVSGLIALVGVMHLLEGVLVALFGDKDAIPIVSKNDDRIILGHILHKFWPVPLAALIATTGALTGESIAMPTWWPIIGSEVYVLESMVFMVFPLVGIIGYSTITFSKNPKKRVVESGAFIGIYGVVLLIVAYFSQTNLVMQIVGIFLMVWLHEVVMRIEILQDNKNEPIYPVPVRGIRVMHVNHEGIGNDIGLQLGDVIEKVNGIEVANLRHFKAIMKQHYKYLKIQVSGIDHQRKELEYYSAFENKIVLGIKLIPEKPPIIFKVSNLLKIGMVNLMRNQKIKR